MIKHTSLHLAVNGIFKNLNLAVPKSIVRMGIGSSTNVFCILNGDEEEYYLRIPRNNEESVLPEILIHKELEKRGVKSPRIISYGDSSEQLNGLSFILMKGVKGFPSGSLGMPSIKSVLYEAGRDLFLINEVTADKYGSVFKHKPYESDAYQGDYLTYREFILNRVENNIKDLYDKDYLTDEQTKLAEKLLSSRLVSEHIESVKQGHLAHGDYSLEHILFHKSFYSGVIDFGDAKIAERGYDLSYFKIKHRDYYEFLHAGYLSMGRAEQEVEIDVSGFLVGIRILSSAARNSQSEKNTENKLLKAFLEQLHIVAKI